MRRNSIVAGVVSLSMLAGSVPVFAAGTDSEENRKIATDLFDKGV